MGHGKTSAEGRQKLIEQLRPGDKVALEAGNVAFIFAREIIERAKCEVVVLNSGKLPWIWDAPTKTDKEDARKLARLIEERRNDQLPLVPIPDATELERRKVVASYQREMRGRTKAINTLHAMFVQRGITTLKKKDLATGEKRAEAGKRLDGVEREEADLLLEHLKLYEKRIEELKGRMAKEVKEDEAMQKAESMIGVGPVIAYAYVAHVGDGSRFSNGNQVGNYLGFVPRLDQSGTINREGHITKRGNGYLRALMVQAAWIAVRSPKNGGAFRERYLYMTRGNSVNKKKSIVAVARRMAVVMYTLVKSGDTYAPQEWKGGKSPTEELAARAMSA
jgi:transposase